MGDDINENFYMNMTLDGTPNNNSDITCVSTQEPMQYEANSLSCMTQQVDAEFPQQYNNVVAEFRTEVDRFAQLFEANPTIHNLRALTKFTNMIKKINTSEQGQHFIFQQIISKRIPRKIKVQSTALSRRKIGE